VTYSGPVPCSLTGGKDFYPTDRWITGRNASFAALNPDIMVSTVSGSWHYNSYGGVAITFDNAKTWYSIPDGWADGVGRPEYPNGVGSGMPTTALQNQVNTIKANANNTSGHAVVTADGSTVIWSITNLNITSQVYTTDYGQNWHQVQYFNSAGGQVASGTTYLAPDMVNPDIVYAFGAATYVSTDGGRTFRQASTNYGSFSTSGLATINGSRDIRPELGQEGVIHVGGNGLWKLTYNEPANSMSAVQIPSTTTVSRYGPGIGVNADATEKALYVYGSRTGSGQQSGLGVWRSTDGGTSWVKISTSTSNPSPAGTAADPYLNANVQYADVRGVVGDSRVFGRVYVSLGNVAGGLVVGDIVTRLVEAGTYRFNGFLAPVKNPPAVNQVKAGSAVPVQFGLGADLGSDILAAGSPKSSAVSCTNLASPSEVTAASAAGSSGLQYDPATNMYTYVWKTDKSWAGTCRQLTVELADGTTHLALFAFK
jgi:hypothetical protein